MKQIVKGTEHRDKVMKGINLVNDLVSSTLGPSGSSAILDRGFSVPIVTTDGVSVARAIDVEDDVERQGVELIREVASKTNEMAGDGTTTSIVLAHAIITEGMKYSENPKKIKKSIDKAKIKIVEELKRISRPLKTEKEIMQVATISSESTEIGKIITDTFASVGKDGNVKVEESKLQEIQSKIADGYEIEKGYVSPFMCNKVNRAEFDNVKVLVIGDKLSTISELLPFLERVSATTKELVIFCVEIDPAVINTFVYNKQTGMFNTLVVRCNSQKNEVLEDVALVTGATFVSKEAGFKFEDLTADVLGKAGRIVSTKDTTTIYDGAGSVKAKAKELRAQLPTLTSDNEYDLVEKRIARLEGNIAVISVGAKTEGEMQYLYYKVEDAVNATQSAIQEGIVEGGGMALYRVAKKLSNDDLGERILKAALHYPLRKIIENAGLDYTDILLEMPKGMGFDVDSEKYVDMVKSGIIDPTKVVRCAVENAVSFAGNFLISKSTVAHVKNPPKNE